MRDAFATEGSGLQRYAGCFDCVEVNSTFYRPSRETTLERWAQSVGGDFRFSLKVPKAVSHEARLVNADEPLDAFIEQARRLGDKIGPLLLQLPPSLAFEPVSAGDVVRRLTEAGFALVCEPRHASWFTAETEAWLMREGVARVAADPARHEGGGAPGGWRRLSYWRLHGSPRVYWSAYDNTWLDGLAERLLADPADDAWCIFDNTASGAAAANALALSERLQRVGTGVSPR